MTAGASTSIVRTLVAGLVDYAGLFPPASLSMSEAAAGYARYREGPDAWMLGRFVVPAARLTELAETVATGASGGLPWPLAVLAGADVQGDVAHIARFRGEYSERFVADVVEAKASSPAQVDELARAVGALATLYVEVPIADDPRALLMAIAQAGVRAKVRTGGVTADAFPAAVQLARFIVRCAELDVSWKATAGLHHPLRAEHRLTYADDAPTGTMFGFLNVFSAGVFAPLGMTEHDVALLLDERASHAIHMSDDVLQWRDHRATAAQVRDARSAFATSFGSCSFREPVDDLHRLALL